MLERSQRRLNTFSVWAYSEVIWIISSFHKARNFRRHQENLFTASLHSVTTVSAAIESDGQAGVGITPFPQHQLDTSGSQGPSLLSASHFVYLVAPRSGCVDNQSAAHLVTII
jgi:hypothetical protein